MLNWSLLFFGPLVKENAVKALVRKNNTMLSNVNCVLVVSKWIPFFS